MTGPRTFSPDPLSVRAARRFVSDELRTCPDMARQFADLLVSELATNSILHAHSDFTVTVEHDDLRVRVAVTDGGGGTPSMQSPSPDAPSGRGLKIVDEFAETWGVDELEHGGKTVWFTLATGNPRSVSSDRQVDRSAPGGASAGRGVRGGGLRYRYEPRGRRRAAGCEREAPGSDGRPTGKDGVCHLSPFPPPPCAASPS